MVSLFLLHYEYQRRKLDRITFSLTFWVILFSTNFAPDRTKINVFKDIPFDAKLNELSIGVIIFLASFICSGENCAQSGTTKT